MVGIADPSLGIEGEEDRACERVQACSAAGVPGVAAVGNG